MNTTSEQDQLTVLSSLAERAARLAPALTAATPDGIEWTAQNVINLALSRGLTGLEQTYLTSGTRTA